MLACEVELPPALWNLPRPKQVDFVLLHVNMRGRMTEEGVEKQSQGPVV